MLQLSVAGTTDYELRIPTRIRSILINCAAGTPDGQIYVRNPFPPCFSFPFFTSKPKKKKSQGCT